MSYIDLYACRQDPASDECRHSFAELRQTMEWMYLERILRFPPIPPLREQFDIGAVVNRDLLMHALRAPAGYGTGLTMIDQIKATGLHIEVAQDLINRFEEGAALLRAELKVYQQNC